MASQLRRVTRNPRMREDQVASLNSRMSMLPDMLRQRERAADIEMQKNQFNQTMKMNKRARAMQDRAAEATMGMEAAKLGMTATTSGVGQRPIDRFWSSRSPGSGVKSGMFGDITTGSIVGGGLAGFGAAKLMGGKSKAKKGMAGAAGGALMGLLGGGMNLANMGSGLLSGAIGGFLG